MPPSPILDPSRLDFSNLVAERVEIEQVNPHRHEFMLLDGIALFDPDERICAGFHDVREDAFWTRGHIPGRPLFPGVLMIEAAAQLASFAYHRIFENDVFLGFTGVDAVKFRGAISPPARLVMVAKAVQAKPRRLICDTQGFVDENLVFEGRITGMPV